MSVQRGKLDKEDESRIRQNFLYIIDNLSPEAVVDYLYQDSIIQHDDLQRINSKATYKDKNKELLEILMNSGPRAYSAFIQHLEEQGYSHIAKKIKDTSVPISVDSTPGDDLLNRLTDDQKKKSLTDKELLKFSKSFSDIKLMGQCFDLTSMEIEHIRLGDQYGTPAGHNHTMMVKWKNKKGPKAATLSALLNNFKDASDAEVDIDWNVVEKAVKIIIGLP